MRQLVAGASPGTRLYFPIAGGDPLAIARINVGLFLWVPLVAVALVGVLRRLPLAYAAYVVASLAVPLSYPVLPQSMGWQPSRLAEEYFHTYHHDTGLEPDCGSGADAQTRSWELLADERVKRAYLGEGAH